MYRALGQWRQEGRICLWRYRKAGKMYEGWHFTADPKGCASLIELCSILSRATAPAHRTISVTDPREVGADNIFGGHNLRLDVPAKIRLANDLEEAGSIGLSAGFFDMPLGAEDILNLSEAMRDVSADRADFGVSFGASSTIFKFWWWPKNRAR